MNPECALFGHKWFFSAPMSDAHLVAARTPDGGLGCFFVPRWRPPPIPSSPKRSPPWPPTRR